MSKNTIRLGITSAVVLLVSATMSRAETVEFRQGEKGYEAATDMEIRGGETGPEIRPQPAPTPSDPSISVDLDNYGVFSQALIRFDKIIGDGPGQIPAGSTITEAKLTILGNNPGGGSIFVHRLLADWDAKTLTWNTAKFAGNSEPGIQADDKEATAAFSSFPSDRTGVFVIDVTPAVRKWVSGDAKNYGLAFTSDSPNGWDFDTCDAEEVEARPKLTVTFTPSIAR